MTVSSEWESSLLLHVEHERGSSDVPMTAAYGLLRINSYYTTGRYICPARGYVYAAGARQPAMGIHRQNKSLFAAHSFSADAEEARSKNLSRVCAGSWHYV